MTKLEVRIYIRENAKLNLYIFIALSTVSDLIAEEAVHHLKCYARFLRLIERTKKEKKVYGLCFTLCYR